MYERNLENRNLLQTYCGSYAPDIYIFSQDFIVLFASDSSVAGEGFMIQYSGIAGTLVVLFWVHFLFVKSFSV